MKLPTFIQFVVDKCPKPNAGKAATVLFITLVPLFYAWLIDAAQQRHIDKVEAAVEEALAEQTINAIPDTPKVIPFEYLYLAEKIPNWFELSDLEREQLATALRNRYHRRLKESHHDEQDVYPSFYQ